MRFLGQMIFFTKFSSFLKNYRIDVRVPPLPPTFPILSITVYGGEEVALPSSSWLRGTQFAGIGFVGMRVKPCNFSLAHFANQQLLGFSPFYFVYWLLAQ